ncbi:TonB-dependent receptor [bacterium]|nr:TonB-dependent receptor [bacterium]
MIRTLLIFLFLPVMLLDPVTGQEHQPLLDSIYTADTVMVWAKKEAYSSTGDYSSVDIITSSDYDYLHPKDLTDVLTLLPGLNLDRSNFVGHNVTPWIRGTNQVLVLIDGVPLKSPLLGVHNLSLYNYLPVKEIEVIRGAASSTYGSQPMGGALNLHLKENTTKEPYTKLLIDGGDLGYEQLGIEFSQYLAEEFAYYLTATKLSGNGERKHSRYTNHQFNMKVNSTLFQTFEIVGIIDAISSEGDLPGMEYPPDISPYSITHYSGNQKDQNFFGNLKFYTELTENLTLMNGFNYQQGKQKYSSYSWYLLDSEVETTLVIDSIEVDTTITVTDTISSASNDTNDFSSALIQLKLYSSSLKNHKLSMDLNYEYTETQSTSSSTHFLRQFSGAIEDQVAIIHNLSSIIRLRLDYDHLNELHLSPFMGLSYHWKNYIFHANYTMGFKNPTVNDLYYQLDEWYCQGNPGLEPETSNNFDLGFQYSKRPIDLSLSFFSNSIDNLIEWRFDETDFTFKPANVAKASILGLESRIIISLNDDIKSSINYSYLSAKDDQGEYLQYRPQHNLGGYLQGTISFWEGNFKFTTRLEERVYAKYKKPLINPIGIPNNEEYYDPIAVGDLKLSIRFHDVDLYFFVDNLYDLNYELRQWFPLPRRYYRFGFSWKFFM